ncbi:MAG: hypothetical protein IKN04_14865 [Clostridia bacterium]|nr:hypothetical protein [Clostridia bacterium]
MNASVKALLNVLRDIFMEAVRKLPEEDRSGLIIQWDDVMEALEEQRA